MPEDEWAARRDGLVPVHDPLAFLAGAWATERTMLDRSSGTTGTFTGVTVFRPDGDGLGWEEEGTARWASFRGPASRSYRLVAGEAGVVVMFPDGRVLCRLDLRSGTAHDEHLCSPDTYRVEFVVPSPDTVRYSWDVTGPAKDLLLTTTLTRRT
ncbi:DUF6314 family protein [Arthrobacter sp. Ld5]|uniref:DUF6314 family protein n=1 Tax=Arthrobacter sp. Ld5 TaxID=649152 RepID=UPI003EBBBB52